MSEAVKVVGVRLPNGQIKVLESNCGHLNEVFLNEDAFYAGFQHINEGAGSSIKILDMINE